MLIVYLVCITLDLLMYNVCHSQLVNDSGGGGGKTKATHYSFKGSFKNYVDNTRWVGLPICHM